MRHLIALALLFGCQPGHDSAKHDVEPNGSASLSFPEVPKLPASPSGVEELATLDAQIANNRSKPEMRGPVIAWLRERAGVRGSLEDYVEAITLSHEWVESSPTDENAWRASFESLLLVHRFADARAALEHIQRDREELAASLSEATGDLAPALAFREKKAREWPRLEFIAHYAASLGASGRLDDALVEMKKAASAARDNPPQLFAWFLFQWGRLLELKGELVGARRFYEASCARMITLEATVHLIQIMNATGDTEDGRHLAAEAVVANRHPDLLALAGRTDEARAAWETYLVALPEAFGDHAARFFLANGDPKRATNLAMANLDNRDTREARELVVEAALAANDPTTACDVATRLVDPMRSSQFLAWRAFIACRRTEDASRLARVLGIGSGI